MEGGRAETGAKCRSNLSSLKEAFLVEKSCKSEESRNPKVKANRKRRQRVISKAIGMGLLRNFVLVQNGVDIYRKSFQVDQTITMPVPESVVRQVRGVKRKREERSLSPEIPVLPPPKRKFCPARPVEPIAESAAVNTNEQMTNLNRQVIYPRSVMDKINASIQRTVDKYGKRSALKGNNQDKTFIVTSNQGKALQTPARPVEPIAESAAVSASNQGRVVVYPRAVMDSINASIQRTVNIYGKRSALARNGSHNRQKSKPSPSSTSHLEGDNETEMDL